MPKKVAVEDSLTPVWEELEEEGYLPVSLDEADLDDVWAVVVSGQDDEIMGIDLVETTAPVINADGMTPGEVLKRLKALKIEP